MNDPGKFKAPYNPKERIWQKADRLRAAYPAGRKLPVEVLDLAEFDLGLDLVPVDGLREQLDIDALLMGDLKSVLVDRRAFMNLCYKITIFASLRLCGSIYFRWKTSSSSFTVTFILSPGLNSPSSRRIDSGLRMCSCTARLSGRAPNCGS